MEIDKVRTRANDELHFSPANFHTSYKLTLPEVFDYDYECPESLCFLFTVLYHFYNESFECWKNSSLNKNVKYDKLNTSFSKHVVYCCDAAAANIQQKINSAYGSVPHRYWRDKINLNNDMLRQLPIENHFVLEEYTLQDHDDTFMNHCYRTCVKVPGSSLLRYSYIFLMKKGTDASFHRAEIAESIRQNYDEIVPSIIDADFLKTLDRNSYDLLVYPVQENTALLSMYRAVNKKISKSDAVSIISQIAEGLYMCRNDFHHRNISPSKIFVTPKKSGVGITAKLAGFTYAKVNQIGYTVSPQMIKQLKNNSNGYSWISSHMPQYTYKTMNDSDFERIDVYSLTAVLAFIIDGKSGVKDKDQTNLIDIDSYYRMFGDDGEIFENIIGADTLDEIPDLKGFNELIQSLV